MKNEQPRPVRASTLFVAVWGFLGVVFFLHNLILSIYGEAIGPVFYLGTIYFIGKTLLLSLPMTQSAGKVCLAMTATISAILCPIIVLFGFFGTKPYQDWPVLFTLFGVLCIFSMGHFRYLAEEGN
ncbi:MAG: hypothetical protein AAB443_04445 [Patescibacteria group bacterium]